MKSFLIKISVIYLMAIQLVFSFECNLPNGCFIQQKKYKINQYTNEKTLFDFDFKEIK